MTKKMIGLVSGTFMMLLVMNISFLSASTTSACLNKTTLTCSNNSCHANQGNFQTISLNNFTKE